jgi:hypothetical protein
VYVQGSELRGLTRLNKGTEAPYTGHLIDDDSLRELDLIQTDLKICEHSLTLSECAPCPSGVLNGWGVLAVGAFSFIVGAVAMSIGTSGK